MDKQYDFKAALAAMKIEFAQFDTFGTTYRVVHFNYEPNHIKALKAALRLADRLQSGEVSERMVELGKAQFDIPQNVDLIFEEMAAQMIKEVEGD